MLAKRRTLWEIGRDRKDSTSMKTISGRMSVLPEAVDDHGAEHQERKRRRDNDVARDRERIGDQPDQVRDQNEHEQREDEREEFHPLVAGRRFQRIGHEFVGQFGDRLQATRHQAAARGRADHQEPDDTDGDHHEQRRIGERDLGAADLAKGGDLADLELMNGVGHRDPISFRPRRTDAFSLSARSAADAGRAHHIEDACGKTEQQKHNHPPGRNPKPAVEEPTQTGANQNASHQLG
jgi:hypothetical protein